MRYAGIILSVIAIALSVWALVKVSEFQNNTEVVTETVEEPLIEIEVADYMSKIQLYSNKMYFAGKENNKALFNFYINETREIMMEISDAEVVADGVDISANIQSFGIQSLEVLRKRIEEEGFKNFEEHYKNLVTSCNSCHKIAQRPFIVITPPAHPAIDSQDYRKGPYSDAEVDMDGD